MKRRALLLSGGLSPAHDRPYYANDVAAYYRILTGIYGYAESDVHVYLGSGGAYPLAADGGLRLAHAAKRELVLDALRAVSDLGADDRIFVMITDHGDPEDGIALWGKGAFLTPEELAGALHQSSATKIIVLGQCSAGTFGALEVGRAVVCCACGHGELSYPSPRPAKGVEPLYNEFLYQLAGALGGRYPDGRSLLDADLPVPPDIPIGAAFRYARDHDRWVPGTQSVTELPRLFDRDGLAEQATL